MLVEDLPIPEDLKRLLTERGIVRLYPPQADAVRAGVLKGKNLVMATPTASGKTLIAEMAMVVTARLRRRKTLYLVPLRAIAHEKYENFKVYERLGLKVAVTTGDYDAEDEHLGAYDVIITTNEKADSLLSHGPPWITDVGLLVADEIHYIDDPKRGPILESVITRLMKTMKDLQVLALSATISNAEELAEWLNAELVTSNWRPVPLVEAVYYDGVLLYADGHVKRVREVTGSPSVDLALDTVADGGQAIVFVSTRNRAVRLAESIAKIMRRLRLAPGLQVREYVERVLSSSSAHTLNKRLAELMTWGVSFHHAGLSYGQRRAIEDAFRNNVLKVIVATPTLAAGVNMPARRVIVDSYKRYEYGLGMVPIKVMEYKQFAGRAGRPGYDEVGEAVLIARSRREVNLLVDLYIKSEPEEISSKLGSRSALRSQVLALVASEMAHSVNDVVKFMESTLYALQHGLSGIEHKIREVVEFLIAEDMMTLTREGLRVTRLGRRVCETYVDPLTASIMVKGLRASKRAFSEFSYLHLICATPDMPKLTVRRREYEGLEAAVDRFYDDFLIDPYERGDERSLLSEVKTTLMLMDWINEVPEDEIALKYNIGPGDLYNIIETAEWLLYAMQEIAKVLVYPLRLILELGKLRVRVRKGIKEELLELVSLEGIGRIRARALYNAGYRGLKDLAKARITDLIRVPGIGRELAISIKEQLKARGWIVS